MFYKYLLTIALSVIPISELRGAIPYGYFNGIPMWQSALIGVLGNSLVPLLGFLFFDTFNKLFLKIKFYKSFFDKTILKAQKNVGEKVEKYGLLGLVVFVAVPLPITGAWTGTLGAWVLGLDRKKSKICIFLGVLIAGIIVTAVVLSGSAIGKLFTKTITL